MKSVGCIFQPVSGGLITLLNGNLNRAFDTFQKLLGPLREF